MTFLLFFVVLGFCRGRNIVEQRIFHKLLKAVLRDFFGIFNLCIFHYILFLHFRHFSGTLHFHFLYRSAIFFPLLETSQNLLKFLILLFLFLFHGLLIFLLSVAVFFLYFIFLFLFLFLELDRVL